MILSTRYSYMVFGLVFGLIFPLSAWTLSIVLSEFDFSLNSIVKIHQSSYLHYIIDIAPVVLATVFFYLGKSIESKVHLIENLGAESDWSNLLLNSTGEAIYGIDLRGDCTFVNSACVKILGFASENDLLGKNMHELIHYAHRDGSAYPIEECKIFKAFQEGEGSHIDDEVLWRSDGTYFYAEYRSSPIFRNNSVVGSIVSFTDISERIHLVTEQQAQLSELLHAQAEASRTANELTQLIDTANAPIFGIDTQGLVNEWNQEAVKLTLYSKEEVVGHDLVQEFITDEYKSSVKTVLDNALKGIETGNYEFPLYTKNGSRLEVLLNATTRKDVEGHIVGVIGVGQNITLQKRAQAEATRIANELTQLIDTANAPIFGIDTEGLVNEWNQEAVSLTGYSKEEVLGHELVQEFITDEYKASVKTVLDDALNGKETGNYEFPLYTKGGNRLEVLLNATTRRNVEGSIVGVIGVGNNMTDVRKNENALNQAQKMEAVGQLTGGIAHDFNNLLSIIGGNLRFLQQDIGSAQSEISELFEDAMSAVDDGAELTQRLLAFSRSKALKPEVINVNQVLDNFSRFAARTLGENIELVTELAEREMFVKVDASQLDNALLNLSLNSRDAMPNGGCITLSANRYEKGDLSSSNKAEALNNRLVSISVTDTGTGIEKSDIKRIFEPFFTTKEIGQGSGLGLSMVYGFARQSNGECLVKSEPGKGTTFSIVLEEVEDIGISDISSRSERLDDLLKGTETVLVVEDETRVRRVTVRDLSRLGYTTIEAENADIARAIIESGVKIDMLFSDVLMPGKMDGHMLALWTQERYPEIKVILTSGFSRGRADTAEDQTPSFLMIRKPYDMREVAKQFRNIFSQPLE
jgi:PAS domain S-box-containing protein